MQTSLTAVVGWTWASLQEPARARIHEMLAQTSGSSVGCAAAHKTRHNRGAHVATCDSCWRKNLGQPFQDATDQPCRSPVRHRRVRAPLPLGKLRRVAQRVPEHQARTRLRPSDTLEEFSPQPGTQLRQIERPRPEQHRCTDTEWGCSEKWWGRAGPQQRNRQSWRSPHKWFQNIEYHLSCPETRAMTEERCWRQPSHWRQGQPYRLEPPGVSQQLHGTRQVDWDNRSGWSGQAWLRQHPGMSAAWPESHVGSRQRNLCGLECALVSQEAVHTMIEIAIWGIKKEVPFPELAPKLGGPNILALRGAHCGSICWVYLSRLEHFEHCLESHKQVVRACQCFLLSDMPVFSIRADPQRVGWHLLFKGRAFSFATQM